MRRIGVLLFALVAGCGYRPARFADRPPVLEAGDDRPIPIPRRNTFVEAFYLSDVYLRRPLVDALDAERFPYARDVNAMDEVPRSSWYSPVPLDDGFARAYAVDGPPVKPATIEKRGKTLLLTDAKGRAYTLIGEHPELPEVQTAASVIGSRLVRAAGYLTPETWLVSPDELGVPRSAGPRSRRWVAVRWPLGVTLGPTDMTYPRDDDPNDKIPHRDRRTLRALGVLAAWLDLRELGPKRLVDAYVGPPGRGHVRHFIVGLNDSLGASSLSSGQKRVTAGGPVEGSTLTNLLTLGFGRPIPRASQPEHSLYALKPRLDPRYELGHPYEPVDRLLPPDGFWMAKRLAMIPFSRIAWSVRLARFSDPLLEDHVIRALEARRRTLLSYWYSRVTPCDVELLAGRTLILTDRALEHQVDTAANSAYEARFLGDDGQELSSPQLLASKVDEVEVRVPELARDYVVVRVTAIRRGVRAPRALEVHLRSREGELAVAGVRH